MVGMWAIAFQSIFPSIGKQSNRTRFGFRSRASIEMPANENRGTKERKKGQTLGKCWRLLVEKYREKFERLRRGWRNAAFTGALQLAEEEKEKEDDEEQRVE